MTDEKYWGEKKPPTKKGAQPDGNKSEKHIAVHENKIYYYANVNRESASELNKKIGENFQSPYHFTTVIFESKSDDIFTPEAFSEILNNQNKLIDLDNSKLLSLSAGINEDNYLHTKLLFILSVCQRRV